MSVGRARNDGKYLGEINGSIWEITARRAEGKKRRESLVYLLTVHVEACHGEAGNEAAFAFAVVTGAAPLLSHFICHHFHDSAHLAVHPPTMSAAIVCVYVGFSLLAYVCENQMAVQPL